MKTLLISLLSYLTFISLPNSSIQSSLSKPKEKSSNYQNPPDSIIPTSQCNPVQVIRYDFPPSKLIWDPSKDKLMPVLAQFCECKTNRIIKEINLSTYNPYIINLNDITPAGVPYYFSEKDPDKALNYVSKFFTDSVKESIKRNINVEGVFSTFSYDPNCKDFLTVTYQLKVIEDLYEHREPEFATSTIFVFDSLGNQLLNKSINGLVVGKAITSGLGKYIVFLLVATSYWEKPNKEILYIIRVSDSKIVYQESFSNLYIDETSIVKDSSENISILFPQKTTDGKQFITTNKFYYLDVERKMVYKAKNPIESFYLVNKSGPNKLTFIDHNRNQSVSDIKENFISYRLK